MTKRLYPRHRFDFFVLEHRPDGEEFSQATRVLICKDFSQGGLRLEGTPRYKKFKATLSAPQDGMKYEVDMEVVHQAPNEFGVRFIDPSDALIEKLAWWSSSAQPLRSQDSGQSLDIDA